MSKFLQISSPLLLIVLLSLFLNQKPKALATETFSLYLPIVLNDLDNSTPTAVPFETPTAVPSETPTIVPSVTPMPEQILRFSWEFTLESSPLPQKFEARQNFTIFWAKSDDEYNPGYYITESSYSFPLSCVEIHTTPTGSISLTTPNTLLIDNAYLACNTQDIWAVIQSYDTQWDICSAPPNPPGTTICTHEWVNFALDGLQQIEPNATGPLLSFQGLSWHQMPGSAQGQLHLPLSMSTIPILHFPFPNSRIQQNWQNPLEFYSLASGTQLFLNSGDALRFSTGADTVYFGYDPNTNQTFSGSIQLIQPLLLDPEIATCPACYKKR